MNLVIVESPTKARTLGRFLGSDYDVQATMGHIRDLPERKIGIKISDGHFDIDYVQTDKQRQRTEEIKKLSDKADEIYFATDPDREGEAIAWHLASLLNSKKQETRNKRVVFHEITETAVREALAHPGKIDLKLVDAQQARRVLDRLVGYKLSPLLWKKIRRGLSAGRVQSVAVRLVVEREREIEAFKPEEYWQIFVDVGFRIQLVDKIANQEQADRVEAALRAAEYIVESVDKKEFRRTPPAPYTTSTLQQIAANKLGWSAKKTMQVAQNLYEEGFITYHRTDSTNISVEALQGVGQLITSKFGREYVLAVPRIFKTKSKMAQEAHEAIRPTDFGKMTLDGVNRDQDRLYEVIWKRFVACQMAEVTGESVSLKVKASEYTLEAKGETIEFDGWYKVVNDQETRNNNQLPEVTIGEKLKFIDLTKEQKFTTPVARYNDASLIKALEEMGIGRPSTYAPTLSTIQDRQYVEKIEKRFKPTELGIAVNDFLVTNFPKIIDYEFTANMEYGLDEIAAGDKEWEPVLADFYGPFEDMLKNVGETALRVKVEVEKTGEKCPDCTEGDLVIRIGKFGRFVACSRYPDCKYKANYQNKIGMKCPKCNDGDVITRSTRSKRTFFGCSNYPKCDFASWTKPTTPNL